MKPRKLQPQLQDKIDTVIDELLRDTEYEVYREKVKGYIADVVKGQAHYKENVFTVPYWAFKPTFRKNLESNGGYFIYYVAHELSHLLSVLKYGGRCLHNSTFYKIFMEICPEEYQYFELNYKKSASKYGISRK